MKKYLVTFSDTFDADTEDKAYDEILKYLKECVINKDLMAFGVEEVIERGDGA